MSESELLFTGTPAQFWAVADDLNSRLRQKIYVIRSKADNNLVYVRVGKGEMEPSEIVQQTVYFGEVMARSMPGGTALRVRFDDEGKSINKAQKWWVLLVERMEADGWLTTQDATDDQLDSIDLKIIEIVHKLERAGHNATDELVAARLPPNPDTGKSYHRVTICRRRNKMRDKGRKDV